jgi:hypothetical protein
MTDIGIYQIVLDDAAVPFLDPGFSPFDWRGNPQPELREIVIHSHAARTQLYERHDLTGVFSAKFYSKTKLSSQKVFDWIADNPGHDIYLISGHPHSPYLAYNGIERAATLLNMDFETPMRALCERVGISLPPNLWRQSNRNVAYASTWVASRDFWQEWKSQVIDCFLSKDRLGAALYKASRMDIDHEYSAKPVVLAPYLYERLLSLYISTQKWKALYYPWSGAEILGLELAPEVKRTLSRIMPVIDDLDERDAWNAENRDYPSQEYHAMRSRFSGGEFNTFSPHDINLPSLFPPSSAATN